MAKAQTLDAEEPREPFFILLKMRQCLENWREKGCQNPWKFLWHQQSNLPWYTNFDKRKGKKIRMPMRLFEKSLFLFSYGM